MGAVLASTVRLVKCVEERRWVGYKLVEKCVYMCVKSMVGGGAWRFRVWSVGSWPCFGSRCGIEARFYPGRVNSIGASDLAGKAQDVKCKGPIQDGNREAGDSYKKKKRGSAICAVQWRRKEFTPSFGSRLDFVYFGVGYSRGSCKSRPRYGVLWKDF
jgi:hypothetical protein